MSKMYIFIGVAVAIFLFWVTRKGNATALGVAAGTAAADLAGGVVQGAATVVGLPPTNADRCAAAIKTGNHLDASIYCDLVTFARFEKNAIFGSMVKQNVNAVN